MAVLKVWEQLVVLQLDLSLAVPGRVPQPPKALSKARLAGNGAAGVSVQGVGSSFLSLGATSPTALRVGHGAGGWDRRLCGDMGTWCRRG